MIEIKHRYAGDVMLSVDADSLVDANLSRAYLRGAIGDGTVIRSAQFEKYHVVVCDDWLQIGCKGYRAHEWRGFSDRKISAMDIRALEWWNKYKDAVLAFADCL